MIKKNQKILKCAIFVYAICISMIDFRTIPEEIKSEISMDSKANMEKSYVKVKKYPVEYNLRHLYTVLYDDNEQITNEIKRRIKKRLDKFDITVKRESLGKINIESLPIYIDVRKMGDQGLEYSKRTVYEWIEDIWQFIGDKYKFDIFSFSPSIDIEWASDSHSVGYYIKDKICFCQEYYSFTERGDWKACGLMLHKMLHGFGYHHQETFYLQLGLIDWNMGIPQVLGLEDAINNAYFNRIYFFNKHILQVLNLLEKPKYASNCIDFNGLKSVKSPFKEAQALYAWDNTGMDVDGDGIVDSEDDYFLSSPRKGIDSDNDGIIDELDLCPWNNITISGNVKIGKINLICMEETGTISFQSSTVDITKVKAIGMEKILPIFKPEGINIYFPISNEITTIGNKVILKKEDKKVRAIEKIEVYYRYKDKEYYRPYYLYFFTPRMPIPDLVNEREWYFFGRFGCDVPADIDLYDIDSYDANHDGFVDPGKYSFIDSIPPDYDWDDDGFPDIKDTLPTVHGLFSNKYVAGVKDSDGDGLADPGEFDFSKIPVLKAFFFGEIKKTNNKNPEWDWSPYFPGKKENHGCPDLDNDNIFWYDDPDVFN